MSSREDWDDTLPEKADKALGNATQRELEEALVHATEFLDLLPYKGKRSTPTQSLAWPREGVLRDDGAPVGGVPPEIKEATRLVAGFILAKIPFSPAALAWVFLKIGHLLEKGTDTADINVTWH